MASISNAVMRPETQDLEAENPGAPGIVQSVGYACRLA